MMMRLLTRARQTGYDIHGRTCVQNKKVKFEMGGAKERASGSGGGTLWKKSGMGGGRLGLLKKSLLTLDTKNAVPPTAGNGKRRAITPIRRPSTIHFG